MTQMLEQVIFNHADPAATLDKSAQEINTLLAK